MKGRFQTRGREFRSHQKHSQFWIADTLFCLSTEKDQNLKSGSHKVGSWQPSRHQTPGPPLGRLFLDTRLVILCVAEANLALFPRRPDPWSGSAIVTTMTTIPTIRLIEYPIISHNNCLVVVVVLGANVPCLYFVSSLSKDGILLQLWSPGPDPKGRAT